MAVVAYVNHQGGISSRPFLRLATTLLLWADQHLLSIRAVHVPGHLNCGADLLSREGLLQGQWRLHTQTGSMIWNVFGQAEVDLFASAENTHCPFFFSLTEQSTLGVDALAHRWPRTCKYAFPPVKLLHQVLCKIREEKETEGSYSVLLARAFGRGTYAFHIRSIRSRYICIS